MSTTFVKASIPSEPEPVTHTQTFKPTAQQSAFIDTLTSTTRNICLRARAGCGKTSSILMGFAAYAARFPSHVIHVCAFNKAIADEVSGKIKSMGYTDWQRYNASTVHSMGFALLKYAFKLTHHDIDDKKVSNLVRARAESQSSDSSIYGQYRGQIISLVSYAKQAGVGFFDDMPIGSPDTWYGLADHFDVNGFDDTSIMDEVVTAAQSIYRASLSMTSVIDYDDMILLPLVKGIHVKYTKDLIFVDEYQDISCARQALIRKFLKPGTGRIIAVGDPAQAIYGFSGADTTALDTFITMHNAVVLPLSVTWRCPRTVVTLAQTIVPDLEASPSADDGSVEYLSTLPTDLTPGKEEDAILCRNTSPLIDIAYSLIRQGIPAKVEGRKIGEGLITLVKKWKVSSTSSLTDKLISYKEREMQKAIAKGNEQKAAETEDRVNTVLQIIMEVNRQGKNTVDDVVSFISSLFADGADHVVTLCTYHRAKGREWNRVILWEHYDRCPSKYARQPWQRMQESNLSYVAFTRSKKSLVFVN